MNNPLAAWAWKMVQDGDLAMDKEKAQQFLVAARKDEKEIREICEYIVETPKNCWPDTRDWAVKVMAWMALMKWVNEDFAKEMVKLLSG